MILQIALLAMLALISAGAGAVAWMVLTPAASAPIANAPAAPALKSIVLVAAHPLRAGSLIKPEDVTAQEFVTAALPIGASNDTPQGRGGLTGSMIRRSLGEGQPIVPADFIRPGDHGFLAAVLGPNMRAITVAVDAVSGTAGLIWPGDRVDLILTQALDDPTLTAGRRVAAETVLSDARVIAIDQQIVQGQAPEGTAIPPTRTATLEVTAAAAERVLVAAHLGKLALSGTVCRPVWRNHRSRTQYRPRATCSRRGNAAAAVVGKINRRRRSHQADPRRHLGRRRLPSARQR